MLVKRKGREKACAHVYNLAPSPSRARVLRVASTRRIGKRRLRAKTKERPQRGKFIFCARGDQVGQPSSLKQDLNQAQEKVNVDVKVLTGEGDISYSGKNDLRGGLRSSTGIVSHPWGRRGGGGKEKSRTVTARTRYGKKVVGRLSSFLDSRILPGEDRLSIWWSNMNGRG